MKKCNYCDFLSFAASEEYREAYCIALMEEIRKTADHIYGMPDSLYPGTSRKVSSCKYPNITSIFLGGGTPSILTPNQIEKLFYCINKSFHIKNNRSKERDNTIDNNGNSANTGDSDGNNMDLESNNTKINVEEESVYNKEHNATAKSEADIEITVEANPGTLTEEKLAVLLESGVNRLSIGLQSTDNAMLTKLGRIHTYEEFLANYDLARRMGFQNINIDLMSALPGQTIRSWLETLDIVTALRPDHISAYSLIIEEGTPFAESKSILSSLPDEETDRRMYELTKEKLAAAGYERYEISNYALPGKECRHNIGYWDGTPYLGLGLGASSYYDHARFSNGTDIRSYLDKPFLPFEEREGYEKQSVQQEMEDRMIFGLRMMQGVSKKDFRKSFGREMDEVYGDVIRKYVNLGLLAKSEDRVRLTERGIDVSNRIFEDFLQ